MEQLCRKVLDALRGRTLVTAESLTGGGIGAALTAIPGSSEIYKGGIISYTNWVKENALHVERALLDQFGPVSAQVAHAMASGVREVLQADVAVSVTGLAGPGGDDFGNEVGTVYIGYASQTQSTARKYFFSGTRDQIRQQTVFAALELVLEMENTGA